MFLDNVTAIVLIAPVTVRIAATLGIQVVPLLMAEALLSDTGGVATLVGDPPNIIIGSVAGFSFNDFLTHALPVVAIAWVAALGTLRIAFRKELKQRPTNIDALLQLRARYALHDVPALRRVLLVFGAVIVLFFLHDTLHVSPSMVVLRGAAAGLILIRPDVEQTLHSMAWRVCCFLWPCSSWCGGRRRVCWSP